MPWSIDYGPAVAIAAGAGLYALGRHRVTRRERAYFAAGVLVTALALLSPLDTLADSLFAAHMTQHVLLAAVVPPLLVLGAPERAIPWLRWLDVRAVRWLAVPTVAVVAHMIAIWSWHARPLFELALRNDAVHALEHLSFVGTGMLVWWRIVHPSRTRRAAYGSGMIALFATATQTGLLGALFTVSRHVLYPAQASGATAFGLTPLADQQLAGLVMWVPGSIVYLAAMSVLFMRWVDENDASAIVATLATRLPAATGD